MTNEEIWDMLITLYKNEPIGYPPLYYISIDDHFSCKFEHNDGVINFTISVENNFLSGTTYHLSQMYLFKSGHVYDKDNYHTIDESYLKRQLLPILREIKLNLIGI